MVRSRIEAVGFQTAEGSRLAALRQERLRGFYDAFLEEIEAS